MKYKKLTKVQLNQLQKIVSNRDSTTKEIKRAQVVIMLNDKLEVKLISKTTGYKKSQIFEIRKKYIKKGITSIEDLARKNPKELLTKQQRDEIIQIIKTKVPDDIGFQSSYWTTALLGEYIKRKYKVKYKSKTSFYLLFEQAKFSYHKPGRVYEKHDEKEVQKWRKKAKVRLKKALKEKDTIVLCEDEMVLSTQTTFQKIWLEKNNYPLIETSNIKTNRSVYGFLNIKTGKEHAYKTERQNMYETTKILKKIRNIYPNKKLLIFWDGPGWHRGSKVQEFIKKDRNIETIYFPPYSPEENPQEHVWKKGRSKCTHNKFIADIDKATDEFIKYLRKTKFNYSFLGCN
jgi:transposase